MQHAAIEQKATLDPAARQTAARVAMRIRTSGRNARAKTGLLRAVGGGENKCARAISISLCYSLRS